LILINTQRMKQFTKVVLVNLAILAVGLLALELIFGSWIKQSNKLNQLNIIRSANHQFETGQLYKSEKPVISYTRDKYGFRTSSPGQPQRFTIVTIGGSTTEQRFISDEDTWQQVLERAYRTAGKQVIIANAGVDGQSTFGHIKNFEWWFPQVPGLHPKYYLFYVGINDLHVDAGNPYDSLQGPSTPIKGLKAAIANNSAIYAMIRRLRGWKQAKQVRKVDHAPTNWDTVRYTTTPRAGNYGELMQNRCRQYQQRIAQLIAFTKQQGATPIFVTQPTLMYRVVGDTLYGSANTFDYDGQPANGVDYYYLKRQLDSTLQHTCNQQQIPYIPMANEGIFGQADFYDLYHMTPAGTHKFGKLLFSKLHPITKF